VRAFFQVGTVQIFDLIGVTIALQATVLVERQFVSPPA
jgi:hypothetical protein